MLGSETASGPRSLNSLCRVPQRHLRDLGQDGLSDLVLADIVGASGHVESPVHAGVVELTSAEKAASEFRPKAERRSALYNQFSRLLTKKSNRAIRLKAGEPAQSGGSNSLLGSDLVDGVDLSGEGFNLRCVVVFHKSRLTPALPTFKKNRLTEHSLDHCPRFIAG